ncbi:hypothetical protein VU11_03695 [Desulfobulbus sp. US2]|nr:hypothetical protein [Desulfobulbus sp. US4]MCW5207763.1 hypothetical protein [Desulfobulbus sp. US2]WLE96949.1 MAG: hypothetical protein QTN59_20025 [Candidatus Electrothrix communis]
MMIRCACPTLFIIFSILLGCAGTSEAQVILSDSIRDILSTAQIDELKANESVKAIKKAKRDEKRNTASAGVFREILNPIPGQAPFIDYVRRVVGNGYGLESNVGVQTIFTNNTKELNQRASLSDPNNADGLAVRFAPSDEELGVQ